MNIRSLRQRLFQFNRNTALFLGGIAGVAHETLIQHSERPTLLILFAAMMGLPAFLSPATPGHIAVHPPDPVKDEIVIERAPKESEKESK